MIKNPFPIPKKVVLLVVGFHVLICCFFFFSKSPEKEYSVKGAIQAKHYTLAKEKPRFFESPTSQKAPSNDKNNKPSKKPQSKKLESKPENKNEALAKTEEIKKVNPAKEPITTPESKEPSKISASSHSNASTKQEPGSSLAAHKLTYTDHLGCLLEKKVILKSSGQVTVKIKLNRKGELISLDIVSASDSDLIGPVQQQIKALDFPSFDDTMKNKKSEVFTFEFSTD